MNKLLKTTMLLLTLVGVNVAATANGPVKNPNLSVSEKNELKLVHKYLDIVLIENNKGKGLSNILDEDFSFHDPMEDVKSAAEFINNNNTQQWIGLPKTYTMRNQIVKDNQVCSFFTITIKLPDGRVGNFELADYVYFEKGKISKENVYFFDPAGFAKFMGISAYLEKYR